MVDGLVEGSTRMGGLESLCLGIGDLDWIGLRSKWNGIGVRME